MKENSYFFKVEREERLISVLCEGEFIFFQGREIRETDLPHCYSDKGLEGTVLNVTFIIP